MPFTTGHHAGTSPQTLSVIFRPRVTSAADLEFLLRRFPCCTSLEMSQRQMLRAIEADHDDEASDASDSETENDEDASATLGRSCRLRRAPFDTFFLWLMQIESVCKNLQELHLVDVSWDEEDCLSYWWSGAQIDRQGSGTGSQDLRKLYVLGWEQWGLECL